VRASICRRRAAGESPAGSLLFCRGCRDGGVAVVLRRFAFGGGDAEAVAVRGVDAARGDRSDLAGERGVACEVRPGLGDRAAGLTDRGRGRGAGDFEAEGAREPKDMRGWAPGEADLALRGLALAVPRSDGADATEDVSLRASDRSLRGRAGVLLFGNGSKKLPDRRVDRSALTSRATATAAATARCVAATLFEHSFESFPKLSRRRRDRARDCDSVR